MPSGRTMNQRAASSGCPGPNGLERKQPFLPQLPSEGDKLSPVDPEHGDRRPADPRSANEYRPGPPEVTSPMLRARVKQCDNLAGHPVNTGDVRSLPLIAA